MASTITKRLVRSGGAFLCVFIACLFLYALKLAFTESLYSRRGSFAFFVTITEPDIRAFPVLDATSEPEYNSSCGDGPKPSSQSISYRSRLSTPEILELAQRHAASCGYTLGPVPDFDGVTYTRDVKTLSVTVTIGADGLAQLDAHLK
jgi:hypothetical protein